jgi:hypothetical protein
VTLVILSDTKGIVNLLLFCLLFAYALYQLRHLDATNVQLCVIVSPKMPAAPRRKVDGVKLASIWFSGVDVYQHSRLNL